MKRLALAISSILLLAGCSTGGTSSSSENAFVSGDGVATYIQPKDRKHAPALNGKTLDGSSFTTSGKIVVLNVWASWCSPCRAEAPLLEDFAQNRSDIQFIGVNTRDNVTSAKSFIKRFAITYPTLSDDSILTKFRNSLTPNAIPTTLIIDKNGLVAARVSGAVTVAGLTTLIEKVEKSE